MRFMLIVCMAHARELPGARDQGLEIQGGFSAADEPCGPPATRIEQRSVLRGDSHRRDVDLDAQRFTNHVVHAFAEHELQLLSHALWHVFQVLAITRR
jgi:hypothetical protein